MNLKKKLIFGILLGLAVLVGVFFILKQTFFPQLGAQPTTDMQGVVLNPDGTPAEGEVMYSTFDLYMQDPVTVDASVKLKTDTAYFYSADQGKIESVLVKNGQTVKKGAILYNYVSSKKDDRYALEDLKRDQTRHYNQRELLIDQLSKLTGGTYNYRGDLISYYWGNDGKQVYYVVEPIGNNLSTSATTPNTQNTGSESEDGSSGGSGDTEGLKSQIRQLNQQIEDIEIKLVRQQEQNNGKVIAKSDGTVMINEEGRESNSVPFIRIVSEDISVTGHVTEYDFYSLAENRAVTIFVPAENRTITGKIIDYDKIPAYSGTMETNNNNSATQASQSAGANGAQFNFVVKPDEYIQPGFTTKVNITLPGFVIPNDTVLEENGKQYVFLYKDGKAHKTEINLIQQGLQKVVLKGLNEGDKLINMPFDIQDGQEIKVIQPMEMGPEMNGEGA